MGCSYFAWLWLARAADFTMDGLISVEGLVLSDHGKAFCHTGMKGFVYPDCSSDTLSEENLRLQYSFAQNRPSPNPIHILNPT